MKASHSLDTTFDAYRVEAKERKRSKPMEGYVQNEGRDAYFVLQRQVPPGGKVKLADAYRSVGRKSGLEEGLEFVKWLRANVLTRGSWGFYDGEGSPLSMESRPEKVVESGSSATKAKPRTKKKVASVKSEAKPGPSSKTSSKKEKDAKGAGRVLRKEHDETRGAEITAAKIIEEPYEQARFLIDRATDKAVLKKALYLSKHFAGKEKHMRHLITRLEQVY